MLAHIEHNIASMNKQLGRQTLCWISLTSDAKSTPAANSRSLATYWVKRAQTKHTSLKPVPFTRARLACVYTRCTQVLYLFFTTQTAQREACPQAQLHTPRALGDHLPHALLDLVHPLAHISKQNPEWHIVKIQISSPHASEASRT